ncbi:stage II sporulation protein [Thermoclostridium stercorarium subsp. stercorarium DSM 8532]|jgi:anti-sigma B factor antagonist|uniref:Anti-sigma factor antagonist n=3 Tax=Thermoclostridium stercorarium TaxID=1510 RepID=L7VUW1_THES1|nr:STAS domain-containing protein [Thermoclostridium stercorarium]AGC69373.1 stage II sporulation protein [Thermoclostridium stercorarium subsp. stercorarium DSM 8532]AGI40333.1 anti-anti-sigma regulator [Thermoclostridium stercorarium subsp. stercorarium DSM 8532]ANW99627.1 anti-anti-sigma factor [Thermoclostridium stercorarium subsp. thermolacticum DSM 2910]ANX02254.1 anti-anti-sigma factor [Thermoclostridium stercorarium subsp. leptospartum DSM 9219]UZQ85331.1 STAS domain-containing protein
MFEMKVDNHNDNGKVRIILSGEIDIATAPEFKTRLYDLIGDGTKDIELVCDGLSYIDSTGLGILVGALKRVKNHQNNVYIYHLRDNIKKLFKITGLDKVFILEEAV